MTLTLPPVKEGTSLNFDHFPTPLQCFVYRNWETVPVTRMAEVLETSTENVNRLAGDMGLMPQGEIDPLWYTAGYITIIKANWHLLPYDQLCRLLGWSEEKLAYILKEDDFLDHKLGNSKPDCEKLLWRELTDSEIAATALVRAATQKAYKAFAPQTAKPFDFSKMFRRSLSGTAPAVSGPDRFAPRIVYSYCALYGDTFIGDTMARSFPDELLAAYRAVGVSGIWAQAVLYTLVPNPFTPSLSDGWEERIAGLNTLCDRLAEYDLKLYLYINEPRAMPAQFFDGREAIRGAQRNELVSLCTSVKEVQDYLENSAAELVRRCPKLGGFITITASENQTNCYSHFDENNQPCPRCKKRKKADVLAEVNDLLYRGASSVKPDFEMIAWTWAWEPAVASDAIGQLNENIGVMSVSERFVPKTIGGVRTQVRDYSISIPGPGKYARDTWEIAKRSGHGLFAKCQFNNSWECAAVPFLPVFEKTYTHIKGLTEAGVDGLMLGWTLGGYPSPTFSMLRRFFTDTGSLPTLDECYADVFPEESLDTVKEACHLFSDAFDKFPFDIGVLYRGPQNLGVGNLLYAKPTGLTSTMTCFAYDDLTGWRSIFPEEVFEEQMRLLTEEWAEGLSVLDQLPAQLVAASDVLKELSDSAEAAYCQFRAVYLQTLFVRMRDGKRSGSLADVIAEEEEITIRCANVAAHNPCIGYESANHYYFNRTMLMEKIVCCEYVKTRLCTETAF